MCLCLFSNLGKCCDECGKAFVNCCKSINPIAFLLSLVTGPLAMFIILGAGLPTALIKWLPGTVHQESAMWSSYCEVLKRGKDAYNGKSRRKGNECCDACLSEVYCCASPCFLLWAAFYPLILLGWLMGTAVGLAVSGLCAGAVRKDLNTALWWPAVSKVIRHLDLETSDICYNDRARGLLLEDCCGVPNTSEQLPDHRAVGNDQVAVNVGGGGAAGAAAAGPGAGGVPVAKGSYVTPPQPQVMAPQQQPPNPPVGLPVATAGQAYVPTAQPAAGYALPVAQPAFGGPAASGAPVPVARPAAAQQNAAAPPPPPPADAGGGLASMALGGLSALGKATRAAASAVEKEAAKQRERQAAQQGGGSNTGHKF